MLSLDKRGRLHVTEAQLQRACIEFLRLSGWYVRPAPRQSQRTHGTAYEIPPGEPDLLAVKGGRALWFELKTATGTLSKAQVIWHQRARQGGERVYVVRSVDQLRAALV
jgi:hypothetical protein